MATSQQIPNDPKLNQYDPLTGLNSAGWGTTPPPKPTYNSPLPSSSNGAPQGGYQGGGGVPASAGGSPSLMTNTGMFGTPTPLYPTTPTGLKDPMGNLIDPKTGQPMRTGAQVGQNAGEALKALQDASGLNLLGFANGSASGGAGGVGAAHVAPPDMSGARSAAFGRAKDSAGQTARAALESLQSEMAGRGILGSGIEGGNTANIIAKAGQGVNEVSREQAIQDANAASQYGQMQYQGDITQRGQDLSAQQANLARQQQMMQGLLGVLPSSLLY